MKLPILVICAIMSAAPAVIAAEDSSVPLSMSEAIRSAVEKNLDVRAELYNPAMFEADIQRNTGIYDPLLGVQTTYTDSTTANFTTTGSGFNELQTLLLNSSLNRLFWTGATASAYFNNSYTTSNTSSTSLKDYWQTNIGATISQPLLKNMGREVTEANIVVSRLSKFASLERFNSRLAAIVSQVRNEYFKLHSLREELEVKKVSLELARKILTDTQARIKAGVLPAMESLNADFGVVSREKELIDAEKAVNDQVDVLRLLLQIEGRGDIRTTDSPTRDRIDISESDALKRALNRYDIREQKRNLEVTELQTRVFSNKMKPDLSLNVSAGVNGQDGTYPRTIDKVGTFDYPVWSIGLNFSYPLGNTAAENEYRKSRLKTEQTALVIRGLEEGAAKEVKSAIRAVTTNYKQIDVADRGRSYAEERLKAFIRKNEVGLATTKDVLDVENDLATAKSNQIKAVVNYANALNQLHLATGEILDKEGIRVVEGDADRLYSKTR